MGLDSVEIVMSWEETFEISLDESEVAELRTPRQAIDLISAKLGASEAQSFCPTMRAFNVFRFGVRQATGDGCRKVRLSDPFQDRFDGGKKKDFWRKFGEATGINYFRQPQILFRHATVRDAVERLVAQHLKCLLKPSETWTRSLVRFGVRYGVFEIVGEREFSDDDRFIEDIGID